MTAWQTYKNFLLATSDPAHVEAKPLAASRSPDSRHIEGHSKPPAITPRLQRTTNPPHTHLAPLKQIMLPDANDAPPLPPKPPRHPAVAGHVPLQLRPPEPPIPHRHRPMPGTPMPEAAIDKHRHLLPAKHKIGPPEHPLMPPPPGDPMPPQQRHHRPFRGPIPPAAHRGHDLGSFRFGEDVRHLRGDHSDAHPWLFPTTPPGVRNTIYSPIRGRYNFIHSSEL